MIERKLGEKVGELKQICWRKEKGLYYQNYKGVAKRNNNYDNYNRIIPTISDNRDCHITDWCDKQNMIPDFIPMYKRKLNDNDKEERERM